MNDINNLDDEEFKERVEHQTALLDIKEVLATKAGKAFIEYLFKSFEVGEIPVIGLTGDLLMDRLGFLRAGNSIFKIVAEANPEIAGMILAKIEKEKHG